MESRTSKIMIGLVLVPFASSIGATLAFLAARFLLKDYVQNKFGGRLKTVNQGIEKDGAFYLFTLRLVPVFSFIAKKTAAQIQARKALAK
ncbi:MAG: VTT domain-containing protein [Thermodesulfobacteriota bacterium]|nr:VTT domain-containing protein [Thermodesulfobacteriota bacterium]